jgi:hypothetical protein
MTLSQYVYINKIIDCHIINIIYPLIRQDEGQDHFQNRGDVLP